MSISVIVTTYNRPEALKQVLLGLGAQACLPGQVLVADDGSAPATRAMIEALLPGLPFHLVHVWQPDEGFRAAAIRNKAIAASTGDYLVCLDGDCIPDPHFLADHLALAEAGSFFQGKRVLVDQALSPAFRYSDVSRRSRLFKWALAAHLGNPWHLIRLTWWPALYSTRLSGIRSCNMGFARQDIVAVNGFDEDYVGWGREDSDLAQRFFNHGLQKKEHPFMAVCFHLWHADHDRGGLADNDKRLAAVRASNRSRCANGLVKD